MRKFYFRIVSSDQNICPLCGNFISALWAAIGTFAHYAEILFPHCSQMFRKMRKFYFRIVGKHFSFFICFFSKCNSNAAYFSCMLTVHKTWAWRWFSRSNLRLAFSKWSDFIENWSITIILNRYSQNRV